MGGRAEIDRLLASAVDAHRAGRVEEAARGYAAVLERDPRHPDALQLLGSALLRLGHPTDALAVLDRTVSLHRRHAVAHVDRARALLALERASEAIEPAQRATRLRPELAAAWVVLARARRLAGELDSAAVAAERAVEAGASSVELAAVRAARG